MAEALGFLAKIHCGLFPLDTHSPTAQVSLMSSVVIKNTDFQLVTEFARTDAKKRLSLGEALVGSNAFNVYRNALGQLFLDPVKAIPADEAWLFENPATLASVRRGLEQATRGEVHDLGDFSKYAKE